MTAQDDRFRRRPAHAGWCDPKNLPKGPNGRALCRHCGTEVAPPRKTFCSKECVEEWRIRTDPGFAKQKVFERDNGICSECKVDTLEDKGLRERMNAGYKPSVRQRLGRWDMDHKVPVVEGGGSCGLENLRTLCKPCHKLATTELARRRAEARRAQRDAGVGGNDEP